MAHKFILALLIAAAFVAGTTDAGLLPNLDYHSHTQHHSSGGSSVEHPLHRLSAGYEAPAHQYQVNDGEQQHQPHYLHGQQHQYQVDDGEHQQHHYQHQQLQQQHQPQYHQHQQQQTFAAPKYTNALSVHQHQSHQLQQPQLAGEGDVYVAPAARQNSHPAPQHQQQHSSVEYSIQPSHTLAIYSAEDTSPSADYVYANYPEQHKHSSPLTVVQAPQFHHHPQEQHQHHTAAPYDYQRPIVVAEHSHTVAQHHQPAAPTYTRVVAQHHGHSAPAATTTYYGHQQQQHQQLPAIHRPLRGLTAPPLQASKVAALVQQYKPQYQSADVKPAVSPVLYNPHRVLQQQDQHQQQHQQPQHQHQHQQHYQHQPQVHAQSQVHQPQVYQPQVHQLPVHQHQTQVHYDQPSAQVQPQPLQLNDGSRFSHHQQTPAVQKTISYSPAEAVSHSQFRSSEAQYAW